MTQNGLVKSKLASGLAICVAGGLLAACSNSNSGFNDPIEDAIGDPLVAMGLRPDPTAEDIEYNPRSPLVMPAENPAGDLPPPVAAAESYGEQWPNDPDEQRRKLELEMRQAALKERPRDVEYASEPMSPNELDDWGRMYGKDNGAGLRVGPNERAPREEKKVLQPGELAAGTTDPNAQPGEPPRTSLVEPPSGYRTPAPTVDGAAPQEEKKNFFQRLWNRS